MKKNLIILSLLGGILLSACDADKRYEIYERPDWLTGKVYTQMLEIEEMSLFTEMVHLTGYDTIIDRSGSYTVFGPNNEAVSDWLAAKGYAEPASVPEDELELLVLFHIVQNPWTKEQLMTLDVWGWIDTLDVNNDEPRGYKRETVLKLPNRKLGVLVQGDDADDNELSQVVDTTESSHYRMYLRDSRKFSPVFFKDYFDIYDLSSEDFAFYFDRSIGGPSDLYFGGGKLEGEAVFAENGFVYTIDRVVDPMLNAYQFLENGAEGQSYQDFLDLCNHFTRFNYNEDETFDQEGADQGLAVDSLFSLTYPDLAFDLMNERTTAPKGAIGLPGNVTIRYHHGVVAPTDAALAELEDRFFRHAGGWGSFDAAPRHIKRIVANSHLSNNPIYQTDLDKGFLNGEADQVYLDENNVIFKEYGSNATLMGLNKAIIPRAFSSVTGPVYLEKGYATSMYAIEQAGLLAALKRENEDYMLFVEPDIELSADSSLIYESKSEEFFLWQGTGQSVELVEVELDDLRTLLLNHVAVSRNRGIAKKEFVKNLAGNYLIVNNETGEVSGTQPTTERYYGEELMPNYPELISDEADNGATYSIKNWFSFIDKNLCQYLEINYPLFLGLLEETGLAKPKSNLLTFLSDNELYTVFAPKDSAIIAARTDTLDQEELISFLKFHFVQGEMIFTDGTSAPGYYETMRVDESSTEFNTVFSRMYVNPQVDLIRLPALEGGDFANIPESDSITNIMTGRRIANDGLFPNVVTTAVIHELDKALNFYELDTK